MSAVSKILTGTLLGAGVIAVVGYVKGLKKTQAELEIIPTANLYEITWNAIVVRVDVLLKNPTKGTFSIKFPFVKIISGGTTLGSSQAVNKDIKIPPYGEVVISKMLVTIPVSSFFSVASDVLKSFQNNKPVKLTIKVMTTVNLGWTQLPYESNDEITLKK
ncbi:MAG: hypothetical protein JNM88_08950 [Chitinophagaceae bacterium]|nr:hypothetical protein [Chitinophagaceae bacterium]